MILIAPSILAADFGSLAHQVRTVEDAGADWIHVDVMDGHFVPNISFGPVAVAAVREATSLPIDVHLMIESPERYIDAFAEEGAHRITIHQETCPHLHRTLQQVRDAGALPGVALNPGTPADTLKDVIPFLEMILVMTVNPGFGGQEFISTSLGKIRRVRAMLEAEGRGEVPVEVDGGIDAHTIGPVAEAGARVMVAGSSVFKHPDGSLAGIRSLRAALPDLS